MATLPIHSEDDYEDQLALWGELQAALSLLLHHPVGVPEALARLTQLQRWTHDLLALDTDLGLYLLFQLSARSPEGYSSTHALMCGVLCSLIAQDLALAADAQHALVGAALSMNIAMTQVQDELAVQRSAPSASQKLIIHDHPARGAEILSRLGVGDALWLHTVAHHHDEVPSDADPLALPTQTQLILILQGVDRFAALISPRQTREGRSAADSLGQVLCAEQPRSVGASLLRLVGRYPPGTFVALDSGDTAVVTRRTQPQPQCMAILDARGAAIKPPQPVTEQTAGGAIARAVRVSPVQERINHHIILQLAAAHASNA